VTVSTPGLQGIQEVSRRFPDSPHGHLEDLRSDPIDLLHRVRDE
jgi:sterol 14-demethylase